jgi:FKBP-type peptidyl-prolyl cis-trans isomerase FkpA
LLNYVKLLFLNYKRINLPFVNKMSRALTVLLFCCFIISACKKETDTGAAAEKAQAIIDDKIISDYLAANPGLNAKRIDTTGVYYIVLQPGDGTALYTNSTQVTVGYTGKLLTTGQVFAKTDSIHPSFVLGSVIRGWQLGIPQVKKGGIVRLLLPSRYAYGPFAQPQLGKGYDLPNGLPASAVLDFNIQIFDIIN